MLDIVIEFNKYDLNGMILNLKLLSWNCGLKISKDLKENPNFLQECFEEDIYV